MEVQVWRKMPKKRLSLWTPVSLQSVLGENWASLDPYHSTWSLVLAPWLKHPVWESPCVYDTWYQVDIK